MVDAHKTGTTFAKALQPMVMLVHEVEVFAHKPLSDVFYFQGVDSAGFVFKEVSIPTRPMMNPEIPQTYRSQASWNCCFIAGCFKKLPN